MKTVFADSYYFLALMNAQDEGHAKAIDFARNFRGFTVTTEWVLTEVGDALSQPLQRPAFLRVLEIAQGNPRVTIVEATHELFARGIKLFASRPDKDWSLTDCLSFVVMEEQAIRDALTADHHCIQAGLNALLN